MNRRFAFVTESDKPVKSRHYRGLPPEVSGNRDLREPLPTPRLLVIVEAPDGVFLYRLGSDGEDCGDTWHLSVDDALAQVEHEYAGLVGDWHAIPERVSDEIEYALMQLRA